MERSSWAHMKLLWQLFFSFLKIGPVTFGGGYAVIPLLEKEMVERKKWITKESIGDVLSLAQTAPGSVAVNTAIVIGFRIAGVPGSVIALLGILSPTIVIVLVLAFLFLQYNQNPLVQAALLGIRPAIVALIIFAAVRVGKTALLDKPAILIGAAALALLLFHIHPVIIILLGAFVGMIWGRIHPAKKPVEADPDYFFGEGI